MKRTPPICPHCREELVKVHENDYSTYVFDSATGKYKPDDGYLKMYCPNCDAKLYDVFPDGVCNYRSKTRKKHLML